MKTFLLSLLLLSFGSSNEIHSELQQKANVENKNIAVYFCGSDWCAVCHKFKCELLVIPAIDSLLNHSYVYYIADFPQGIKQEKSVVASNEFLAEKLNPGGEFPVLVIADENWNVKTKIYRGNTEVSVVEKLTQFKK